MTQLLSRAKQTLVGLSLISGILLVIRPFSRCVNFQSLPSSLDSRFSTVDDGGDIEHAGKNGDDVTSGNEEHNGNLRNYSKVAPLYYHISPGSTATRTLFHAACAAGFPSVHHKSFCISRHRGIGSVDQEVVNGVRSHFELLRLYQLATDCVRHYSHDAQLLSQSKFDVGNATSVNEIKQNVQKDVFAINCQMEVPDWKDQMEYHLSNVVGSGVVGLFDTPYPYLSTQVLNYAAIYRAWHPANDVIGHSSARNSSHTTVEKVDGITIGMTLRDPILWAISRIKHHGLLLCQEQYSSPPEPEYHNTPLSSGADYPSTSSFTNVANTMQNKTVIRGASEFNILNCVTNAITSNTKLKHPSLYFWDVFQYQPKMDVTNLFNTTSHANKKENGNLVNSLSFSANNESTTSTVNLVLGMERQMSYHQKLYLPMADYTPDIFHYYYPPTVNSQLDKKLNAESMKKQQQNRQIEQLPIEEITVDIRYHLLFASSHNNSTPTDRHEHFSLNDDKQQQQQQQRGTDVDNNSSKSNSTPQNAQQFTSSLNYAQLQHSWKSIYNTSLTCRGRVYWDKQKDVFEEEYHLPKTCLPSFITLSNEDSNAAYYDNKPSNVTSLTMTKGSKGTKTFAKAGKWAKRSNAAKNNDNDPIVEKDSFIPLIQPQY